MTALQTLISAADGTTDESMHVCVPVSVIREIAAQFPARLTVCEFRVGEQTINYSPVRITEMAQLDGPPKWAVRRNGRCLNTDGKWEYEPMPSSRDDEFLARCRFSTVREALDALEQAND